MEAFWVAIAFVAGLVAKAARLPTLVGYLAAGLLLSASGVTVTDLLLQIGDLGVMLLLFTVGLHLRLKSVARPEVLGAGLVHLLVSVALFSSVLLLMEVVLPAAILTAVALGFSSTVLTAKTLEARGELGAYHGRLAIGILIVQDIVAVGLLAFLGTERPTAWAVALLLLPLLRPLLLRILQWSGREELLLLFGLLMALGIGFLFEQTGLNGKLGALVAGVLLTGHRQADELYDKLWGIKEVFLVGFFLQVGLTGLPTMAGLLATLFLLLLLPVKGVLFFFLLLRFRLRARTAFMTAVALTTYSEFALIVATAAAQSGLLATSWVIALALLTAVSYALNAPISKAANGLWARYEHFLVRFELDQEHPDHAPHSFGSASYLILGMGRAGTAAYDTIATHGERPLGLDVDPARIEAHLAAGRRVIFGDAQDPELWHNIRLDGVKAIVMTLPNMNAKIRSTQGLRTQGFDRPISALIRQEEDEDVLRAAGVNAVSLPVAEAGRELAQVSLLPEEKPDEAGQVMGSLP